MLAPTWSSGKRFDADKDTSRVTRTKVSTHRQRLELDLGSRSYSKDFKRLAAPDRVRQAERDTALLVYGNVPPAWISLRPWYRDRGLRAQVSAPPAPRALPPVTAEELA